MADLVPALSFLLSAVTPEPAQKSWAWFRLLFGSAVDFFSPRNKTNKKERNTYFRPTFLIVNTTDAGY